MSTTRKVGGGVTPSIVVIGDDTNDYLKGGANADTLNGRGGDDHLYGYSGNDTLNGGAGIDVAHFDGYWGQYTITRDASGRYVVAGLDGTDTVTGVERFAFYDAVVPAGEKQAGVVLYASGDVGDLVGGPGDDSLSSNTNALVRFVGGGGNDAIYSGKGGGSAVFTGPLSDYTLTRDSTTGQVTVTDQVAGRDGRDTVSGSIATLTFADGSVPIHSQGYDTGGDDVLVGTVFNDSLTGGYGNDQIDGVDGTDTARFMGRLAEYDIAFDATTGRYTVTDKVAGRDGVDVLSNIEQLAFYDATSPIGPSTGGAVLGSYGGSLVGTAHSDSLTLYVSKSGSSGAIDFTGGGGNDVLDGGASPAATAIYSGAWADYVISFDETISQYTVRDKVSGRDGTDFLRNIDQLEFSDVTLPVTASAGGQTLVGTDRANTLTGGSGNDSLSGLAGNDTLNGGNGIDVLLGGAGNDRLDAGNGDDWLNGGSGNDVLIGRAGSDTAVFRGARAEYAVSFDAGAGTYRVTDSVADRDGIDTVHSSEWLQFADGTVAIASAVTLVGTVDAGASGLG